MSEIIAAGIRADRIGVLAQEICEKYLKHLIEKYLIAESETDNANKAALLRTHNLRKLIQSLINHGFGIDSATRDTILKADGFCFTTRYPSDDAYELTEDDIMSCYEAAACCKKLIEEFENSAS